MLEWIYSVADYCKMITFLCYILQINTKVHNFSLLCGIFHTSMSNPKFCECSRFSVSRRNRGLARRPISSVFPTRTIKRGFNNVHIWHVVSFIRADFALCMVGEIDGSHTSCSLWFHLDGLIFCPVFHFWQSKAKAKSGSAKFQWQIMESLGIPVECSLWGHLDGLIFYRLCFIFDRVKPKLRVAVPSSSGR